ncbi:MAG TPA: LytTR family transcriptional regulator DNA-binding domain-containing protein [Thermoanaerobaculia bacterium]|nr:LytTR family transcriptional regulator DNA-binding domain-containing protein [Thermoanaerobaculia bacterium]
MPRSPIRIVIADDEAPARAILREYLADAPECEVVAECANGFEAVKAVNELGPDLLFLDIQMPKLDGFEVIELLERRPKIIFVTAYDEFALRAFEVHAIDYLLKPFSADRFRRVLDHATALLGAESQPVEPLARAVRSGHRPLERVAVRSGEKIDVLPVSKIDYIEASDDYVTFAAAGEKHTKQQTLAELESLLDPRTFVRIHRSYLVNIAKIAKIELYAKDSRIATLKDGSRIPVSRSGYARLRELL